MDATGFSGDPFHEGLGHPMDALKGGMDAVHVQEPMNSEAMTNPRSAATDNVGPTWNSTSLAPLPAPTGDNDAMRAH